MFCLLYYHYCMTIFSECLTALLESMNINTTANYYILATVWPWSELFLYIILAMGKHLIQYWLCFFVAMCT